MRAASISIWLGSATAADLLQFAVLDGVTAAVGIADNHYFFAFSRILAVAQLYGSDFLVRLDLQDGSIIRATGAGQHGEWIDGAVSEYDFLAIAMNGDVFACENVTGLVQNRARAAGDETPLRILAVDLDVNRTRRAVRGDLCLGHRLSTIACAAL